MGNWYLADPIAEDHIHTDITCNNKEPQQKYRLGTGNNSLLMGLKHFYWIQTLALSFCSSLERLVSMKVS